MVHTVAQRLLFLDKPSCFTAAGLCQLHQFFVACSVERQWHMDMINDVRSLMDGCREAFVGAPAAPSMTQQQVSETLRHMGLSVEDEVRCSKSGYSIDMLVHDKTPEMGVESSSSARTWIVEFDDQCVAPPFGYLGGNR